jgi:hypothetical protein
MNTRLFLFINVCAPFYSRYIPPLNHIQLTTVHRPGDDPRARNVVMLAEVTFVTIQRENILPSKITDYRLTNAHELLTTE